MDNENASMEPGGKHFISSINPIAKLMKLTRDRIEREDVVMKSSTEDHQSLDIPAKLSIMTNTHTKKTRACTSILGITVLEKMVYYSIFGNLVMYLSQVLHFDVASSAKNVNSAIGVSTISALVGAYIADTHLGRYWTIVSFFIVYSLGLASMTIATSLMPVRPNQCLQGSPDCIKPTNKQINFFLFSLYLVVVGTSANPCYQAFGGDQFDDQGDVEERKQKTSYFNWLYIAMCSGCLIAFTFIVYIQENISWEWAFALLTTCMLMALITFVANHSNYRKRPPAGSPFIRLAQVLVAATRNWKAKLPSDHRDLYELTPEIIHDKAHRSMLMHTSNFKFLDKASICLDTSENTLQQSAWRLCTVTQVEEMKLIVRVIPVWLTCLTYGICFTQMSTFFVKQGSNMDTRLGVIHVPPASMRSFSVIASIMFMPIYEKLFIPFARHFTGNMRGVTMLQRIGIGLVLATLAMVAGALVEKERLSIVRELNLLDNLEATIPMSCLWLIPQAIIMGIANDFSLAGIQEFFYDQLPDNMRSVGVALYVLVWGVGSFLSSLVITIIVSVTGHGGHHNSWIVDNLNRARLDKYYWTLAITSGINFCIFVVIANWYIYKQVPKDHSTQETSEQASSISLLVPTITTSHKPCKNNIQECDL